MVVPLDHAKQNNYEKNGVYSRLEFLRHMAKALDGYEVEADEMEV